jgi:type IV pilus assembly protein PilN
LEGLQKERLREVKILDNLQKDIPEKVWLTRMEFADTSLKLTGAATADMEISTFMDNLGKSVFLRDVSLVKATDETSEKGVQKVFDILCTIDRPSTNEVKR